MNTPTKSYAEQVAKVRDEGREAAWFEECHSELRKAQLDLAGALANRRMGAYRPADVQEMAAKIGLAADIMADACAENITWQEARDQMWEKVGMPAWREREVSRITVPARVTEMPVTLMSPEERAEKYGTDPIDEANADRDADLEAYGEDDVGLDWDAPAEWGR